MGYVKKYTCPVCRSTKAVVRQRKRGSSIALVSELHGIKWMDICLTDFKDFYDQKWDLVCEFKRGIYVFESI